MNSIYIHPAALVECTAIGEGTRIWAFSHVQDGVSIGADCNIGEHCFIETGVVIGSCVTIKNGNQLWDGITLADGVFVGPAVCFTNDLRPRSPRLEQARARYDTRNWLSTTEVKEGASIGAGAIILAGNSIGEFAMVGAGAIVTCKVPAYALAVGTPARVTGWVCECGCRLEFARRVTHCKECGLEFVSEVRDGRVVRVMHASLAAA